MDKKIAGLLGAAAALTTMTAANAASSAATTQTEMLQVSSYADLLAPVPNAVSLLIADDTVRAQQRPAAVQLAQHHHHHHRHRRHRHHHHHHSNFMAVPRANV